MGLFFKSYIPNPSPTPQKTLGACIQNFLVYQHCIGCGEGERQDIFEKATLRYEGTLNVQKIHCSKDFRPELQLSAVKREINLPKRRRHDDSISVKSRIFL